VEKRRQIQEKKIALAKKEQIFLEKREKQTNEIAYYGLDSLGEELMQH
jgi:hypothetical protein